MMELILALILAVLSFLCFCVAAIFKNLNEIDENQAEMTRLMKSLKGDLHDHV